MQAKINAITITLEKDISVDDAEALMNAIRMFKGVIAVEENVLNSAQWIAEHIIRQELGIKLYEIIYPEDKK